MGATALNSELFGVEFKKLNSSGFHCRSEIDRGQITLYMSNVNRVILDYLCLCYFTFQSPFKLNYIHLTAGVASYIVNTCNMKICYLYVDH